jgi:tellurite resistance protein TerC
MHVNELPFINSGQHIDWAPNIDSITSLGVIVVSIAVSAAVSVIAARSKNKLGQEG